jgi:hypothetical protein
MKKDKEELECELYAFLDVKAEVNDDFSDPAFFASLESDVEWFNKQNKSKFDPYDTVMAWLKEK